MSHNYPKIKAAKKKTSTLVAQQCSEFNDKDSFLENIYTTDSKDIWVKKCHKKGKVMNQRTLYKNNQLETLIPGIANEFSSKGRGAILPSFLEISSNTTLEELIEKKPKCQKEEGIVKPKKRVIKKDFKKNLLMESRKSAFKSYKKNTLADLPNEKSLEGINHKRSSVIITSKSATEACLSQQKRPSKSRTVFLMNSNSITENMH
ncbi:unnamed protein product [Moneuplotes crassus]|uniref:Uncharacterized protein n=1 Tax=Euplotes crassus TaxID=5936 RepID=A0AAD1XIM3_EUPCR|nr:unnamed protein product [Moneuplotes crassus]